MSTKIFVSLIVSLLLVTSLWSQEPPGWVNLGNLSDAIKVRDVLEIPGTSILLACGHSDYYYYSWYHTRIWRSTDSGQNWYVVLNIDRQGSYSQHFVDLERDPISGRIWAVRNLWGDKTLYYSTDDGYSWTSVSGPPYGSSGNTIEIIGDYLYYGGTIEDPYSIALYRLNQTSLEWEIANSYPECNAITELTYHNGKLIVFCRDKSESLVRVFSHTPASLDLKATKIGKATTSEVTSEK